MSINKLLTDIADAIRRGTGKTDGLTLAQMPAEIDTIGKQREKLIADITNGEITELKVPDGVKYIRSYAFGYCMYLEEIDIPEGVESIGQYAFSYCIKLKELCLPSTTAKIGASAFMGCSKLSVLKIRAITPPSVVSATINSLPNVTYICVPAEAVEAYKTATYWKNKKDKIMAIWDD